MIEREAVIDRIEAESDDNETIRDVFHTGSDKDIQYFLCVVEKDYEGNEMLMIRFFALHPQQPENDTWMSNGVNFRTNPKIEEKLGKALIQKSNGVPAEAQSLMDLSTGE